MSVNSFAWILPWAEEIIDRIHYIQIDCSFRAFPDYSFCLWHGIYFNQSIPFALTLFPEESFQLFNIFFYCLKSFKSNENLFKGRIVLADMGASIKRFCKIFNMGRFVCHRHLIEKFWAKSPLGIMVTRLLKTKNETEYFQLCSEISVELKMYEQ